MTSFENILITGANRGIGFEFVRQFLAQSPPPLNVIATTRNPSDALSQLQSTHANLHIVTYDATNYASYPGLVSQISQILGSDGLDLLVNNAGFAVRSSRSFESATLAQDTLRNIEVNAVAPLELTRQLLPLLKVSASGKKKKTVIFNISSRIGSIGDNTSGGGMPYRSSKAALNMLSRSAAIDLKGEGIIVLAIHPGAVKTEGFPYGQMSTEESVAGMLKVLEKADLAISGSFLNFKNEEIIW